MRRPLVVLLLVVAACSSGDDAPPAAEAPLTTTTAPAVAERAPSWPPDDVLLVWSPGGLPAGLASAIAGVPGVEATAVVLGDVVPLDDVPIEVLAFDCAGAGALLPDDVASAICDLGPSDALLGETSAGLRGDGVLDLAGATYEVAGSVPDEPVGFAEVVRSHEGAAVAGVDVERYVLADVTGDRAAVEATIRAAAGDALLRVRAPDETEWFRHADAVLPQVLVKERFGEFALAGGGRTVSPAWREGNIVTADLPIVGAVPCHREVVPALTEALGELESRGLVTTVDRTASGCFNPRPIAGTDQPSRHTWGIAIDLVGAPIGPEVIEVMARWGFTWGGDWLTPDPIHFEWVREPTG